MSGQNGTQGTATSRAHLVRPAIRRASFARLALSGPSGSGKTWSALSMATVLAPDGPVVVVDTEEESSELYADQFSFQALPWSAPYDPRDLAATITELSHGAAKDGVLIVDSASHFWRGQGGTLDIADGRFGGWKTATPAQDDLVMAILRAPCHVVICTRAKQSYEVNESAGQDGRTKQSVVKLGLAPIQRDDFEYEMNVVGMIDMEHRIDIGKTRCSALAGKSYQANHEHELAQAYGDWLQGGVILARQAEVDQVVLALNSVQDREARTRIKAMFADLFGRPERVAEDAMGEVREWVTAQTAVVFSDEGEALISKESPPAETAAATPPQPEHAPCTDAECNICRIGPDAEPAPETDAADQHRRAAEAEVAKLTGRQLSAELAKRNLSADGGVPERQQRLADAIAADLAAGQGEGDHAEEPPPEEPPGQATLGPVDEVEPEPEGATV